MSLLEDARRVAFVHAHPDDETLATGALIVDLVARGVDCHLLTCTCGERGEVVEGVLPPDTPDEHLVRHRQDELAGALRTLGIPGPVFLGSPPARTPGLGPRRYCDSGMRWITPTVAGPDEHAPADAFSLADLDETAADIATWLLEVDPDVVVTYDETGGYGHPDHVHARRATERAVVLLRAEHGREIALYEVAPTGPAPRDDTADEPPADAARANGVTEDGEVDAAVEWDDLSRHTDQVVAALRHHASQLTVEGTRIVHVGGQLDEVATRMGLRRVL